MNSDWFLSGLYPSFFSDNLKLPFGETPIVCSCLGWKIYPDAVQKLSKCLLLSKLPHFRDGAQ